jgi:hypothetical protein
MPAKVCAAPRRLVQMAQARAGLADGGGVG